MKTLMRITSGLILSICLAIVAVLVTPAVSNQKAHAAPSDCLFGYVCFYDDINYSGDGESIYPERAFICYSLIWPANNQVSSIYVAMNLPTSTVHYFDASNCTGSYIISGAGTGAGWSWVGSAWNDRISSFEVFPY